MSWKDKDKAREYMREYMRRKREEAKKNPELMAKMHEQERIRMVRFRERLKATNPEKWGRYLAGSKARMLKWRKNHPEKAAAAWARFVEKHGIERRSKERVRHAIKVCLAGGVYRPCFSRRKPDWMPVGKSSIDAYSKFLDVNITESERDFAKELARDRFEAIHGGQA